MILGVGTDLVDLARFEAVIERSPRLVDRLFTPREAVLPMHSLAARFAAKEAVSKAFGTGIGKAMGWKDIDVRRKESGEPFVVLEGGAKKLAEERKVSRVSITLSHTEHYAMAMVVMEGL